MENNKTDNIVISWFFWHFYEAPKFLFSVWKNYLSFFLDYFSVPLLIATLFSPWRKYKWRYPRGFDLWAYFETFISNFFSRIMGAMVRVVLIVLGVIFQIFIFVAGILLILLWVLMPWVLIGLVLVLFVLR